MTLPEFSLRGGGGLSATRVPPAWQSAGPRLGLALGGGAALGAAHVGVLQALHSHGVHPGIVTGTSAGALVGAAYAAGISVRTIERLVLDAQWSTFGQLTLSPRLGLFDSSALATTINNLGGDPLIEDLPRRLGVVATDMRERRAVVLKSGPLSTALRASIAVPGLFPPVIRDGRMLVDGGLAANLPIEAARQMGATHVIAVRLRPEWERVPIVRSADAIGRMERESSTTLISPDITEFSQWSTSDVPHLIQAGREATERALQRGMLPLTSIVA